jgi:hypothetical protein
MGAIGVQSQREDLHGPIQFNRLTSTGRYSGNVYDNAFAQMPKNTQEQRTINSSSHLVNGTQYHGRYSLLHTDPRVMYIIETKWDCIVARRSVQASFQYH